MSLTYAELVDEPDIDENNRHSPEERTIVHSDGRKYTLTMEKWYWFTLDFLLEEFGWSIDSAIDLCEEYRDDYSMDYALRYYVQEHWQAYEKYRAKEE